MNTQTEKYEKYDEVEAVLAALGPEIDDAQVAASIDAAINCRRDKKLHVVAVVVAVHCGFESADCCEACGRGRDHLIKNAIISDESIWPEVIS